MSPVEISAGAPGQARIVVISDSTGETAEVLFSRVLASFEGASMPAVKLYGYVSKPMQLAEILATEAAACSTVLVLATLVDPNMMQWLQKLGDDMGIEHVNVMAPLLETFNDFLGSEAKGRPTPLGSPLAMQQLDERVSQEFMGMIDATNFVLSRGDARHASDWVEADFILVGVPRSGMTGIASVLAQRGKKVACVKIEAGSPIPAGLDEVDPKKVVLITRGEDVIMKRRRNRLALWQRKGLLGHHGLTEATEAAASLGAVKSDLKLFDEFARSHPKMIGPLDCTYLCEDETSSRILDRRRGRAGGTAHRPTGVAAKEAASPLLLGLVPAALAFGALLAFVRPTLGGLGAMPAASGDRERRLLLAGAGRAPASCVRRLRRGVSASSGRRGPMERMIDERSGTIMEMEDMIAGSGAGSPAGPKSVFLVSDGSGETIQLVLSKVLAQYANCAATPAVRLFNWVGTPDLVEEIVREASSGSQTLIFATLVKPALQQALKESAKSLGVSHYNVMAPLLRIIRDTIGSEQGACHGCKPQARARGTFAPGAEVGIVEPRESYPMVNTAFFQMAEAVQFAQQHIAGLNAQEWPLADVLLVGPSRVGMKALACYLAQKGIKAACITIRLGTPLPATLRGVDSNKVVLLTMAPEFLLRRRENRVRELEARSVPVFFDAGYTDLGCIELELDLASQLSRESPGWHGPIDITDFDLAEAGDLVMDVVHRS